MTPNEFVATVVDAYVKSRLLKLPPRQIEQGRIFERCV